MDIYGIAVLAALGLGSGLLAGVMGLGGGVVLVPLIQALGYSPVQAVATSSLAIVMTSISASFHNYRMGNLNLKRVISLGLPSLFTAQLGVFLSSEIPDYILLGTFSLFLVINIFLSQFRNKLVAQDLESEIEHKINHKLIDNIARFSPAIAKIVQGDLKKFLARIFTGGLTGFLAGFYGIGGGVILVPLQMVLLSESIVVAIQTSLGVIMITSLSACLGHGLRGNILFFEGFILGLGGLIGAQISSRFLLRLSSNVVATAFNTLLAILSVYVMYLAYTSYH
ncbi:putative permease [Xenococcus sp. PCC 7305]|uniref:sulfite exporter TauE/SafE family protein n=1 Tax=Xenococcus sp. PCC 7305 TaxID=102125 RepID=UPI0002ACBD09|nr:sulfite exporter TauE/SafE family protein [Xenococcus sp. PCC 7305]ELS01463.1 putative permease [Xenococcus sp. PCC 7305]